MVIDFFLFIMITAAFSLISGYVLKDGPSWQIMTLGVSLAICILVKTGMIESVYILVPVLMIAVNFFKGGD